MNEIGLTRQSTEPPPGRPLADPGLAGGVVGFLAAVGDLKR